MFGDKDLKKFTIPLRSLLFAFNGYFRVGSLAACPERLGLCFFLFRQSQQWKGEMLAISLFPFFKQGEIDKSSTKFPL